MEIDFNKNNDGLVPVIIQDNTTKNVLMLGYMNEEAYLKTNENNKVTYSCQYNGRKRHGKEFCYDDDGNELVFEYINGKKVKE